MRTVCLIISLSLLLAGCASDRYVGNVGVALPPQETKTQLGVRYLLGHGVPQNDQKAFAYFLSAAKSGDPFAQNEVAYLYAVGKGVDQDYEKALRYYEKAANHGLSSAQYSVGLFYENGLGTEMNKETAKIWFQKAAAKGFLPAKKALEHS